MYDEKVSGNLLDCVVPVLECLGQVLRWETYRGPISRVRLVKTRPHLIYMDITDLKWWRVIVYHVMIGHIDLV